MSLNNFLRPSLQRQPAMFVYEQKTLAHALPGMKGKGQPCWLFVDEIAVF